MPSETPMELWLQIQPQYCWHDEAYIRGNKAALKELAYSLLAAADGDAATTRDMFASDGEGYRIEIRRIERPDDFPDPYYTTTAQWQVEMDGKFRTLESESARLRKALEESERECVNLRERLKHSRGY